MTIEERLQKRVTALCADLWPMHVQAQWHREQAQLHLADAQRLEAQLVATDAVAHELAELLKPEEDREP